MTPSAQSYRYRVDEANRIVWVDERWLAFGRENGAPELTRDAVLGRCLWDFVAGDATRCLFEAIHAKVRSSGDTAVIPFRCDSPRLQRHMRLKITREGVDQLLYESVLLRVEPQPHLSLLDPRQARSDCVLTICSCCKRALLETQGWLGVDDVSVRLGLFDKPEVPQIRYTVCPDCNGMSGNPPSNGNAA